MYQNIKFKNLTFILLLLLPIYSNAQDMAIYTDNWEGEIEDLRTFNLKVEIENLGSEKAIFKIYNSKEIANYKINVLDTNLINISIAKNIFFEGLLSSSGKEINSFIKSGLLLYHLKLIQSKEHSFIGYWNILIVNELKSKSFYLSVENGVNNEYEAYPILADNRFTGNWCGNFQKKNDTISFSDLKTGLQFKGKLLPNKIQLGILIGNHLITEIDLYKSKTDWKIGGFKTDNKTSKLKLIELENLIAKDSLPNTHAILVLENDKLIYETYYDGFNASVPHDMRSAAKSISSAIVGIAYEKLLFKSVKQSIFDFLPAKYQTHKNGLKAKIDILSLLTMSSGLDAIDYGINANPKSPAVEANYQTSKDWVDTILITPMINSPNTKANYGSANSFLLGIAMDSIIKEPLELFIDKNLFQKLDISNYVLQTDLNGNPYFGGGMYLTSKDMLKFGALYLNKGKWNGKRVLSKKWIKNSFKNYHVLENTKDKNGYGYLWWHHTYKVKGKYIKSIEARGAGGQYIFIIPSLNSVVVITSGNFRNGKTKQLEKIFENYILPYLKK